RLEEEKKTISDDIRDVYAEAKGNGYDTKALRTIIRMRKQDANERAEQETILETYMQALGMLWGAKPRAPPPRRPHDTGLTTSSCKSSRQVRTALGLLKQKGPRLAQRGGAQHERLCRQLCGRRSREAIPGHAHHRIIREGHGDRSLRLDEVAAHLGHLGVAEHGRRHRTARARRQHHDAHPDAVALSRGETV